MPSKWEVNRAVRASGLTPPSRLIMLVLSDIAEAGTAEIPARHTPSLKVLATETGLNEATVKRHLNALDEAGWLKRTKPTIEAARRFGERTRYQLLVPIGQGAPSAHEDEEEGAQSAQGRAHTAPTEGAQDALSGRTQRPIDKEHDLDDRDDQNDRSSSRAPKADKAEKPKKAEPYREDVERVCQHLVDRLKANDFQYPKSISDTWRREARLLMDADGRTEEQVHKAIDWATNDSWWKANIRSIPKLRAQYDALRSRAEHERRQAARASPAARPSTTDARVNGALAAGQALAAKRQAAQALNGQQPKEISR